MTARFVMMAAAGLGVMALLAVGVTATRWQAAEALTNCSTSTAGLDGEETAALQQINAFRAENGRPALLVAPSLNQMAAWKSADSSNQMGPNFSHTDSLGRAPYTRAGDCGYPGGAAENIADGYPSGAAVVQGWINSDGHRRNMLGSYAVMGIGRTGSSWTLNLGFTVEAGSFAVGGGSPPPPPPAFTPAGGSAPPPTPIPQQGGGAPPTQAPAQEPQQAEPPVAQPPSGLVPRTVLPGGDVPAWKLPANVPVRRAMLQMVAAE